MELSIIISSCVELSFVIVSFKSFADTTLIHKKNTINIRTQDFCLEFI